jgi:hypothetical protein
VGTLAAFASPLERASLTAEHAQEARRAGTGHRAFQRQS